MPSALEHWISTTDAFLHRRLGLPADRLRHAFHRPASAGGSGFDTGRRYVECAHYARQGGVDVEYDFVFGWSELVSHICFEMCVDGFEMCVDGRVQCGIANRGTHDTALHDLSMSEIDGGEGLGMHAHDNDDV